MSLIANLPILPIFQFFFTSTFTDILEFMSKFTDVLVNPLAIDLFIRNIVPCNNLTRLPIFFRDPFFRGITRFR